MLKIIVGQNSLTFSQDCLQIVLKMLTIFDGEVVLSSEHLNWSMNQDTLYPINGLFLSVAAGIDYLSVAAYDDLIPSHLAFLEGRVRKILFKLIS